MKKGFLFAAILFLIINAQAQNVGIGTSLPQAKLHISGGLLLDGSIGSTPVSGSGARMMWIPEKAAFRAGLVNSSQWDNANIGDYSFGTGSSSIASGEASTAMGMETTASSTASTAIGQFAIASGFVSTAMGTSTIASGSVSTAMGFITTASGGTSTAMGFITTASGTASTAMGVRTKSKSYGGFTAGTYNDSTNAADPNNFNVLNRIFQIGNGSADNARSNAMTVLQNGNVGIGTTTPNALLNVRSGAVLFDGSIGSTPVSGSGARMMWIPEKAAFRAGLVNSSQWDNANIGDYSFGTGSSSIASGEASTAMGMETTASSTASTAMGQSAIASGFVSTAMGTSTIASGSVSTAMGFITTASGGTSTAMGFITTASGTASTAMGIHTKSKSFGGFTAGMYNDSTNAADPNNFNVVNRIFQIGNGSADNARSNAMTVLQNGNVGIGELNPGVPLNFASTLGDKISLYGNSGAHYGFGILNNLLQMHTDLAASDIAFGWGSSGSFNETMRIKGNGRLGIGTTLPQQMLSVYSGMNIDQQNANNGTTVNSLRFGDNSGEAIASKRTAGGNQAGLDFYTGGVNSLSITNGGNVGIGTTAPTAKLSVNGTANNATGTWGVFSDERVKTISNDFTDGLNIIKQINPVTFRYNEEAPFKTDEEQIGIVAQDLEKIAPYMVSKQSYRQFDDLREVNNQAYVFLLINAIKEQQGQIESLQKENRDQKKLYEVQEQRITTLEQIVKELSRKIN